MVPSFFDAPSKSIHLSFLHLSSSANAAKLEAFIAQIQSEIDTEPVDAMVMLDVDGPKV